MQCPLRRRSGGGAGVRLGARPTSSTAAAREALRSELARVAPTLPIEVGTMAALQVARGYAGSSIALTGRMVAAGTVIALLLAVLGIVGVVREGLSRRTREIGLRMALGARAPQVIGVTAWESASTALAGIALGLAVIFPLDQVLSSVVFDSDVSRLTQGVLDPRVLATAALVVVVVAATTAVIAAGRAAGVDPAVALRSE